LSDAVSWGGNGEIRASFVSSSKNLLDGATVAWREDGVFNMVVGSSQQGPTPWNKGGAESARFLRKPAKMVVWSRKIGLAAG